MNNSLRSSLFALRSSLFALILFFFFVKAAGQQFITSKSLANSGFNAFQMSVYDSLANRPEVIAAQLVELGDIANFESSGMLNFQIPSVGLPTLSAKITYGQYVSANEYEMGAEIQAPNYGQMRLICQNGLKMGFLNVGNRTFEISPITTSRHVISELEPESTDPKVCGSPEAESENDDFACEEFGQCPATIRILFLVQSKVYKRMVFANMNPFLPIRNMVADLNFAFSNSGLGAKKAEIAAIESFELDNFANFANADADKAELNTNTQVPILMAQYRADIVVLLTNRGYPGLFGTSNLYSLMPSKPYCIVEIPFASSPRFTFTHEVGHLLGARHRNDPSADCGKAHKLSQSSFQRNTVVYQGIDTDPRILFFSNPDIFLLGIPTGTENRNNAKVISNVACGVASNQPDPCFWDVSILGPNDFCLSSSYIGLNALITPPMADCSAVGPYSYQWEWSTSWSFSGSSSPQPLGNSGYQQILPLASPQFWVRVIVTAAGGEKITKTVKILNDPDACNNFSFAIKSEDNVPDRPNFDDWAISPNPASEIVTIAGSSETPTSFVLVNSIGQIVGHFSTRSNLSFDVSNLPQGLYILKNAGTNASTKLTVTH